MIRSALLIAAAAAPLLFGLAVRSRKMILVAGALTPVLLGMVAALHPRPRRGFRLLLALVGGFALVYALVLYYVWLRLPW